MAKIGDMLGGDARFATLMQAVRSANLLESFNAAGPVTIFAPTNDAFLALPEGNLEKLLKDANGLRDVLLYHIVDGRLALADISKQVILRAVSGKEIPVVKMDKHIYVDDALITEADLSADNGLLHVVDQVMLPF